MLRRPQISNNFSRYILKHQIEIKSDRQFGSGKRSNLRRVKYSGELARRARKRSRGAENQIPCMRRRVDLVPEVAMPRSNRGNIHPLKLATQENVCVPFFC